MENVNDTNTLKRPNPLLEGTRIPGETFRLPSNGLFYKNGELSEDVVNGEVHVYPLTTYEEILIKTPDLIYSGEAIDVVFKRCIPQIIKPLELLTKDVDFLLFCLRRVTYGIEFEIPYKHTCENAEEHTYVLSVNDFITSTKRIDPTTITTDYSVKVNSGKLVKFQPIRYKYYVRIMQVNESDLNDAESIKNYIHEAMLDVIVSVDGIEDKSMILEWLNVISANEVKQIGRAIESTADWGPSYETKVTCIDCGESIPMTVPMHPAAFFTVR